jgi:hypothetical protein
VYIEKTNDFDLFEVQTSNDFDLFEVQTWTTKDFKMATLHTSEWSLQKKLQTTEDFSIFQYL